MYIFIITIFSRTKPFAVCFKYLGEKLIISTLVSCVSNAQAQPRLSPITVLRLIVLLGDLGGWRRRYNMIAAVERAAVLVIVVVEVTDVVVLLMLPHRCGWGFRRGSLHHGLSSPFASCTSAMAQRNNPLVTIPSSRRKLQRLHWPGWVFCSCVVLTHRHSTLFAQSTMVSRNHFEVLTNGYIVSTLRRCWRKRRWSDACNDRISELTQLRQWTTKERTRRWVRCEC